VAAVEALAAAVDAIGDSDFGERLVTSLGRLVAIDHVAIFAFDESRGLHHLLTDGRIEPALGERLADNWVGRYHDFDPNLSAVLSAHEGEPPRLFAFDRQRVGSSRYLDVFFGRSGLIDKLSVISRRGGRTYYCNFYRRTPAPPFAAAEKERLGSLAAFLVAVVAKHAALTLQARPGPLPPADTLPRPPASLAGWLQRQGLSPREAAVCLRILRGFTTEATALDLGISANSVKTLRSRAYRKLGIGSQAALFDRILQEV